MAELCVWRFAAGCNPAGDLGGDRRRRDAARLGRSRRILVPGLAGHPSTLPDEDIFLARLQLDRARALAASTGVQSASDLQEGSLDRFAWQITIFDDGPEGTVEAVVREMRSGHTPPPPAPVDVLLAGGVAAKTWTSWDSRGELNQEQRRYVFKAPNGHVYSVLQPMPPGWRMKRRYDNLFRDIIESMKFKDVPAAGRAARPQPLVE